MRPPTAESFITFARDVCDTMFADGGTELSYDDFLAIGLKTGVVREDVADPENPDHRALMDEWEIEPGATIYVRNF